MSLLFVFQCASGPQITSGDQAFQYKKFMLAAELYKKELDKVDSEVEQSVKAFRIAESYRKANKVDKAEQWYERAVELNYGALAIYTHAQMLKQQERYEEAIQKFKMYMQQAPGNKARARRQIRSCRQAMEWKENITSIEVVEQKNVNTRAADYLPTFYGDEVVFSSQRSTATGEAIYEWTGEKFSDLFVAEMDDQNELRNARLFDEKGLINTPYNEGTSSFNSDLDEIYFTRCGSEGDEDDYCRVYWSKRNPDGSWAKPEPIELFADSFINVGHPNLSPDGKKLYFVADAPQGVGGKDIYFSTRTSGNWGAPQNLGKQINTKGDEMFPFSINDSTLYFSSDGYIGMGGLDIYIAQKKQDGWHVKNLRYPLNSGGDDFGITVRDRKKVNKEGYFTGYGFFSSSRPGGKGSDDIYKFTLQKPLFFKLNVLVLKQVYRKDSAGKELQEQMPLSEARVELKHVNLNNDTIVTPKYTSDSGRTRYELYPQTDYRVTAKKKGFFSRSKKISTKDYTNTDKITVTLDVELVLDTIIEQKEIVIQNIYYDYDSANIREDAYGPLDTLAKLLKDNPNLKVEIASHTDSRGNDEYNMKLSQRRAQSVVDYLISQDVTEDRLIPKGYGETKLLNDCDDGVPCSEEQHQRNRRTTFKVVGIDREFESIAPEQINIDSANVNQQDTLAPAPLDTTSKTPSPNE